MHIKTENNVMVMTESLVCPNYSDMKHFGLGFEKVIENEYKCNTCGAVLIVKEPVLVHDDKGRLKMQISVEQKQ
jgi:hypothetical protein